MHSTLQAELRFSRALSHACQQCARRPPASPRVRPFHAARRLRAPVDPRSSNNASSVSGRAVGDGGGVDNKDSRPTPAAGHIKPLEEDGTYSTPNHDPNGEPNVEPDGAGSAPFPGDAGLTSYLKQNVKGGGRRRVGRRMSIEASFQPPEWFADHNVVLYGEGCLAPTHSSHLGLSTDDGKAASTKLVSTLPPPASPKPQQPGDDESTPPQNADAGDETSSTPLTETEAILRMKRRQTRSLDGKEHWMVQQQWDEVVFLARGLLQPTHPPEQPGDTARNHLLLQYAGKNGHALLDKVVVELSRTLEADLVVLDPLDVADLIHGLHHMPDLALSGRTLSYEVYHDIFPDPDGGRDNAAEEAEDDDDFVDAGDDAEGSGPKPTAFVLGKPVTIQLGKFMGRPRHPRSSRLYGLSDLRSQLSDMFKTSSSAVSSSPAFPSPFGGVVEGLLSAVTRRTEQRAQGSDQAHAPKRPTLIHVQELKAMQDIPIGHQFLQELFIQVQRRKAAGDQIMLVGTDSANESQWNSVRINEFQQGDASEISQNVVITPCLPDTDAKLQLVADRRHRIATINLRHLVEALRQRNSSLWPSLEPGFWKRRFQGDLAPGDHLELSAKLWPHSHVNRLATLLAGAASEAAARLKADSAATTESAGQDAEETSRIHHLAAAILGRGTESVAAEGTTPQATQDRDVPLLCLATRFLKESDNTKHRWAEKDDRPRHELPTNPDAGRDDSKVAKIRQDANRYEKKLMGGIVEPAKINTTFSDVHMPTETLEALETLTTLSLVRPDAFKYGVLASDRIPGLLLYGPPGTGKTLAAKAVAKVSGATMLEVSAADINDMYVGEGEKNVKAVFSLAKKLSPCIVFLDEADAMFSARSNQGRRVSHRETLNQFLKEWDGMSNDSGSAFIMVATNRPMDLDDAVLRRLPRRLLVDLPTEDDRREILKIHLRHENLDPSVDLAVLAKGTPFYSGSDLKNLAVAAALSAVKDENAAQKAFLEQFPAEERETKKLEYAMPERRTLTKVHFDHAMEEITASISEDMNSLKDIKKFDEQYGDRRGKKKKKAVRLGFPTAKEKKMDTLKVRE